eukprot:326027-Amphidinium_carterae.2
MAKQAKQIAEMSETIKQMTMRLDRGVGTSQTPANASEDEISCVEKYFQKMEHKAIERILEVLPLSPQGLMVEHRLVKEILQGDIGRARMILQAGNTGDVYRTLGQALKLRGHRRLGEGITLASQTMMTVEQNPVSELEQSRGREALNPTGVKSEDGTSDKDTLSDVKASMSDSQILKPVKKRRGRPPGVTVQARQTAIDEMATLKAKVVNLARKVQRWEEDPYQHERASSTLFTAPTTSPLDQPQHTSQELRAMIDKLDIWLADLGAANLKAETAIKQLQDAVGLPGSAREDQVDNDINLHLTIQLLESRIIAVEHASQTVQQLNRASGESGLPAEATHRISGCEQKIENIGAVLERFAKTIQANWVGMQGLAQKVQITHDAASLALRHVMRGLVTPVHLS